MAAASVRSPPQRLSFVVPSGEGSLVPRGPLSRCIAGSPPTSSWVAPSGCPPVHHAVMARTPRARVLELIGQSQRIRNKNEEECAVSPGSAVLLCTQCNRAPPVTAVLDVGDAQSQVIKKRDEIFAKRKHGCAVTDAWTPRPAAHPVQTFTTAPRSVHVCWCGVPPSTCSRRCRADIGVQQWSALQSSESTTRRFTPPA